MICIVLRQKLLDWSRQNQKLVFQGKIKFFANWIKISQFTQSYHTLYSNTLHRGMPSQSINKYFMLGKINNQNLQVSQTMWTIHTNYSKNYWCMFWTSDNIMIYKGNRSQLKIPYPRLKKLPQAETSLTVCQFLTRLDNKSQCLNIAWWSEFILIA